MKFLVDSVKISDYIACYCDLDKASSSMLTFYVKAIGSGRVIKIRRFFGRNRWLFHLVVFARFFLSWPVKFAQFFDQFFPKFISSINKLSFDTNLTDINGGQRPLDMPPNGHHRYICTWNFRLVFAPKIAICFLSKIIIVSKIG